MSDGTIKIFNACRIRYFEYLYMLVMVVYAARMTPDTSRMVGSLSGNPIPFLIPIFLTVILLARNYVKWNNKKLYAVLAVFLFWSILSLSKYHAFGNSSELSYHFFLFYAILMAFIHVQVYGKKLLPVYEHIMTWMSALSLPLWILNILFYNSLVPSFFEDTSLGYNILYVFNWLVPAKENGGTFAILLRNSGCAWEPGLFSTMICLAIYSNLSRNGVSFRNNSSIVWLLLALLTSQSTTGYFVCFVLYVSYAFNKLNVRNVFLLVFVLLPLGFYVARLDFMGDKIEREANIEDSLVDSYGSFEYGRSQTAEGEYLGSLGRFESMYFDWQNMLADPMLGYSRNSKYSHFYNNVTSNFSLTGGLAKVPAQYGIPYGMLIFVILAISSSAIAGETVHKRKMVLFIMLVLLSISYEIWCVPIFTAVWMYGLFSEKKSGRVLYRVTPESVNPS